MTLFKGAGGSLKPNPYSHEYKTPSPFIPESWGCLGQVMATFSALSSL